MTRRASPLRQSASAADLADKLHSTAIHLLRRLRRVDAATGLSAPKLSALSVIVFAGPISLGDLAAAEQVRPPTITHVVRDLERAGLVRREAEGADRRVTRVCATPDGRRLLKQGRRRRVALLAEWLQTLSPAESAVLRQAVSILEQFARPKR